MARRGSASASASPLSIDEVEVDEHHRIVPHLAAQGGEGALILFDSHDDCGIPDRLRGRECIAVLRRGGRAECVDLLDIGTWVLPAAFSGAYSTLLWINQWATNLPHANFCVLLGPREVDDGEVALAVACGPDVPAAWRALWADYAIDARVLSAAEAAEWVSVRVIMTDLSGGSKLMDEWCRAGPNGAGGAFSASAGAAPPRRTSARVRAGGGAGSAAGCVPSPPAPTSFQITVDLDFFSVRAPALRALPFADTPGFRRDLIALAKRVPMEAGLRFRAALEALASDEDCGPHDVLHAVAAAAGVKPGSSDGAALLSLLASVEHRFNEDLRSLAALGRVLDTLLLANLAEHEATHEELDALEAGVAGIVAHALAAAAGGGRAPLPVLIARSELYTPRRQLDDIRVRARRAIAKAAAAGRGPSPLPASRRR